MSRAIAMAGPFCIRAPREGFDLRLLVVKSPAKLAPVLEIGPGPQRLNVERAFALNLKLRTRTLWRPGT
jgi:hypothetical protein